MNAAVLFLKVYAVLVVAAVTVAAGLLIAEWLAFRDRRRADEQAAADATARVAAILAALRAEHEYLDFLEDQFAAEGSER
jgi:cytochrome bd-type quinol oxidase subunit 2